MSERQLQDWIIHNLQSLEGLQLLKKKGFNFNCLSGQIVGFSQEVCIPDFGRMDIVILFEKDGKKFAEVLELKAVPCEVKHLEQWARYVYAVKSYYHSFVEEVEVVGSIVYPKESCAVFDSIFDLIPSLTLIEYDWTLTEGVKAEKYTTVSMAKIDKEIPQLNFKEEFFTFNFKEGGKLTHQKEFLARTEEQAFFMAESWMQKHCPESSEIIPA